MDACTQITDGNALHRVRQSNQRLHQIDNNRQHDEQCNDNCGNNDDDIEKENAIDFFEQLVLGE
ncbi:hypothetical protein D3C72_2479090 [compost metagenome]